MKTIISFIFFLFIIIGCQEPTAINENLSNKSSLDNVIFSTDKSIYTKTDTIKAEIDNRSSSDILIFLRCNFFLEMYYQKKGYVVWSENLFFSYMSLRCPTHIDTLKSHNTFKYSISSKEFESTGEFRLLLDYSDSKANESFSVYSNTFAIK
jgi:hypothetical protein